MSAKPTIKHSGAGITAEAPGQQTKNLEYLRDALLNGTVSIMGCMKQIENHMESMTKALRTYEKDLKNA